MATVRQPRSQAFPCCALEQAPFTFETVDLSLTAGA